MAVSIHADIVTYAAAMASASDGQLFYASDLGGAHRSLNQLLHNMREVNAAFRGAHTVQEFEVETLRASGLTYPTEDGTDGQALLTNGDGGLYWGTIDSGESLPSGGDPGQILYTDGENPFWDDPPPGGGGYYQTVESGGTPVTQEDTLNFDGTELVATPGSGKTEVALGTTLSAKTVVSGGGTSTVALTVDKSAAAGASNIVQQWSRGGTARLSAQFDASDNSYLVAQSGKSLGLYSSGTGGAIYARQTDALNTAVVSALIVEHMLSSGTAADPIGVAILLQAQNGSGTAAAIGQLAAVVTSATAGAEESYLRGRASAAGALTDCYTAWPGGFLGIGTDVDFPSGKLELRAPVASFVWLDNTDEISEGHGTLYDTTVTFARDGVSVATISQVGALARIDIKPSLRVATAPSAANTDVPLIVDKDNSATNINYLMSFQRSTTEHGALFFDSNDFLTVYGSSALLLRVGGADVWALTSSLAVFSVLLKNSASGNEQTTVGSAGGASVIPVSPTKYLKIRLSDNNDYVVPCFASA